MHNCIFCDIVMLKINIKIDRWRIMSTRDKFAEGAKIAFYGEFQTKNKTLKNCGC